MGDLSPDPVNDCGPAVAPPGGGLGDDLSSSHPAGVRGAEHGVRTEPSRGSCPSLVVRPLALDKGNREMGGPTSTGPAGGGFDNAMVETFFARLDCGLIDRMPYRDIGEGSAR